MTHPPTETREASLDPGAATRIADEALSFQLGTTTRPAIDRQTRLLVGQVEAFFEAGLPEDDTEAEKQRREITALLNSSPAPQDPAFSAHTYMRALGRVLRRQVRQYEERQVGGDNEECGLAAGRDSGRPAGTYRVPSGLATLAAQRWLSVSGGGYR
ncbi:hypothetical protein [Streptomyces nitrosporeus]|uniref:hypothetical protein n=1 Tax=Streptomyces nitrosporeus TaxID=28894 RepID=UPI00331941D4